VQPAHVDERTSVSLAPTSLDRLIERTHRAAPALARASDLVVVATCAALTAVDLLIWATDPEVVHGRLPFSLGILVPGLGVLATFVVAWRSASAVAATVVLAVAGIALTVATVAAGSGLPPSFAALFALSVLTARSLRREPGGTAVALAALAGVAVASEALRPLVASAAYLLVVCEGAFAGAVGVGVYLRWSDWRRGAAADAARTSERLEIARELHDLVGHYVTGMVVQAQAAAHVSGDAASTSRALERIEGAGTEALAALHQVVVGLRSGGPSVGGTWDDVDDLIASAVADGTPVHATIDPAARSIPPALIPSVHRIVAESLTNVRRHARQVTDVEVTIQVVGEHLEVVVADDGAPTAATGPDTFGIVGMRERAASFGGTLDAGPVATGGWRVRAVLPVERRR